jgi:hypothetical protein
VAIPFASFRAADYSASALALAHELYAGLAFGEHTAIALFAQLSIGLTVSRAPFELTLAATQASSDETRHAEYCAEMAALCGPRPSFASAEEIAKSLSDPFSLEALDLSMLKYAAVSETLAVALLSACRKRATDPVARALLNTLVADEVHHARLGWYYAAYRAPNWSLAERQRLADAMAEVVVGLEAEFYWGRDAAPGSELDARALGVLDTETQRRIVGEVMVQEILPGLDALGFNCSRAWELRPECA